MTNRAAVLLLAFNRPDVTEIVLKATIEANPAKLYVVVDGPRHNRPDDQELCRAVQSIISRARVSFPLISKFRSENMGCGPGVADAISWFFENEPEGIILEDDCLPHPDFFHYCNWALQRYRKDRQVWHIAGNNFGAPPDLFSGRPFAFVALAQVWGWASWRDRWLAYEFDGNKLASEAEKHWRNWQIPNFAAKIKLERLREVAKRSHTWDFQWQITVLNHNGLCLVPRSNMIINLGDGVDATHTLGDARCHLPWGHAEFDRNAWDSINLDKTVASGVQGYIVGMMGLGVMLNLKRKLGWWIRAFQRNFRRFR